MGFDKPDLGFVIRYQSPSSVVHYYQQVGRAGRALDAAYGVLLSGEEETDIADYFIRSAFPTPDEVRQVIEALEAVPNGLSVPALLGEVNVSKRRVEKTIELLSLESPAPIAKEGPKWQLTAADLSDEFWERADRLTRLRREEQRQMQEYVGLEAGHMEFLIRALDGEPGAIRLPDLPPLPTDVAMNLLQDAVAFLGRTSLPIEQRKQWPPGGMPQYDVRGNIAMEHRAEAGRALCIWGDAGWGGLVRVGKYQDGRFADVLVDACVDLMRRWNPRPALEWVTCIPSRRHPNLVPDFAERLAMQLGLPFHRVLEKDEDRARTERDGEQHATGAQRRRLPRGLRGVLAPWPGVAGGRHGGFALDIDGRGVAAAYARQRRGVAARPRLDEPRLMRAELSSNAQAILLLTAPLIAGRGKSSADPLTAGEYRRPGASASGAAP